jgi:transcriptional regulator with XRE-family HTH domain
MTIGSLIRTTRASQGLSLRQLAARIGVCPSHLSFIERDQQRPSPKLAVSLEQALHLAPGTLSDQLARLTPETREYLTTHPTAGRLLRRIAELGLGEDELAGLERQVDRIGES